MSTSDLSVVCRVPPLVSWLYVSPNVVNFYSWTWIPPRRCQWAAWHETDSRWKLCPWFSFPPPARCLIGVSSLCHFIRRAPTVRSWRGSRGDVWIHCRWRGGEMNNRGERKHTDLLTHKGLSERQGQRGQAALVWLQAILLCRQEYLSPLCSGGSRICWISQM